MKAFVVIAILLGAFALTATSEGVEYPSLVRIQRSPDTIFVKPPPGCVFFECIPRCKQQGHKNGGICTINGCVCL